MKRNKARERRITMEIVVDAYTPEEQSMGWYYYLEGRLRFPFWARCTAHRPVSPLQLGEKADVTGMAPEDECEREMFVMIRWQDRPLAVPLSQLVPVKADKATQTAVEDWHYWVRMEYEF